MLNCCLLTQAVLLMKKNQKMFIKNLFKWKDLFGFSQRFFDETNKTVIEKIKDEFGEVIVTEFGGLKSKMYSMKKLMVNNVI